MKCGHLVFLSLVVGIISCNTRSIQSASTVVTSSADSDLKDIAPFPIGTAINIKQLLKDEKLKAITIANFNSITATNDMKIYRLRPAEGISNWSRIDTLAAFCEANNMRLFGHNLIWHLGVPKWIIEKTNARGDAWLKTFADDYITTYVTKYKDKVAAWDVVNEAFEDSGSAYRKSFWYTHLGADYIERAFRTAHAAAPNADLFYNDFSIEQDTAKLNAVLKMVDEFKANGVPITGLGFQMHMTIHTPDSAIANAFKRAAATGLKIHISELDISINEYHSKNKITAFSDSLSNVQAAKYKNIAMMYRQYIPKAQQFGITLWEFNDRDTWIRSYVKQMDWPTLLDDSLTKKPAFYGFAEGLTVDMGK